MAPPKTPFTFWRITASLSSIFILLASAEIGCRLKSLVVVFSLTSFWWVVVVIFIFLSVIGIILVWMPITKRSAVGFSRFHKEYWPHNGLFLWSAMIVLSLGFSLWVLLKGHIVLNGFASRFSIFILASSIGALFLRPMSPGKNWKIALAGSMLITTAVYKSLVYLLPALSASPFSLSWSEGSRYYYGSLFLSESVYGMDIPPSPWHASRYLLMALPFLCQGLPIWIHRMWQVFLWIGLSGLGGYLLAKRIKIKSPIVFISFGAWSYLILNLGPVYYHLVLCVIILLWGIDFDKPTKTFVVLILSSIWAGLSRINWVVVPAFMTASLYFLERPWNKSEQGWKYFIQPVLTGLGGVIAFISYLAYLSFSGNEASKFGSSFTSDLLWNRLWPNPTYQMGILLGVVIISVPMWLILINRFRETRSQVIWLKWIAYAVMLTTLLLGGLVVSVKIGGGSNLHDMDAYFVLLMTTSAYMYWKRDVFDSGFELINHEKSIPEWISVLLVIVPVMLTIREGWVITLPDINRDRADLPSLQQSILDASTSGGEVLFIAERQVQVFNQDMDIPFVPEYEKLELMEMAMAGNDDYLNRFYDDILNRRFSLIILDAIRYDMKDRTEAFSEEHNVWVEKVILPLLKGYQYSSFGDRSNINLLTPKE